MTPLSMAAFGLRGGEWTFEDPQLRSPFKDIAEHDVARLMATYDRRGWSYAIVFPDGARREVRNQ